MVELYFYFSSFLLISIFNLFCPTMHYMCTFLKVYQTVYFISFAFKDVFRQSRLIVSHRRFPDHTLSPRPLL